MNFYPCMQIFIASQVCFSLLVSIYQYNRRTVSKPDEALKYNFFSSLICNQFNCGYKCEGQKFDFF